jgi:hypothetical protein
VSKQWPKKPLQLLWRKLLQSKLHALYSDSQNDATHVHWWPNGGWRLTRWALLLEER